MTDEELEIAAYQFVKQKEQCTEVQELQALSIAYARDIPAWHMEKFKDLVISYQGRKRKDLQ